MLRAAVAGYGRGKILRLAAATALSLVVALPAQALAGAHSSSTHHVVIKGYAFRPSALSVRRGDVVTWLFEDGSIIHNVTGHGFRSSNNRQRGSFTVHFSRAGSFSYTCTLHPWMTGLITVR